MNDDASSFTFASIGDLHVKDGQSGSLRELFQAISKSAGALVLAATSPIPELRHRRKSSLKSCVSALSGNRASLGTTITSRDMPTR